MLENIYKYLSKNDRGSCNYAIPNKWLHKSYEGERKVSDSFVRVNPYHYISWLIKTIINNSDGKTNYLLPLSRIKDENSTNWITSSNIYGAFVRSTVAYGHENPGLLNTKNSQFTESGTFLKMIMTLNYLKDMNIDTLYLLPVTKFSNAFKKGETGSPYAVKNFFSIEPRYHDKLLNDFNVEDEFKAFIEAAHIINMRVVLDFIPRTSSRDSELILDHPEWFYWIDINELNDYEAPKIEGLGFAQPSIENLEKVYSQENVKNHLKKFRFAPNIEDPERWHNFVAANRNNPDFLTELTNEFGVITPPGFSDWINDNQPIWKDITFLRLYEDHPIESRKYLPDPDKQPPYILFDTIKASDFPGNKPNMKLWDTIESIMPFYNDNFGVDGSRLDMGHALPDELEERVIKSARKNDPAFAMIAEELSMSNDEDSKKAGYDCFLGNSWWMEPRIEEGKLYELCFNVLPQLKLPVLGSAETPDTPRAVARKWGKSFSRFATSLNFFLPNMIPFINSGQEFYEIQPMNLGLDNDETGRYLLPKDDPFYGKLAFFDNYALHWKNEDMNQLIKLLSSIRNEKINLIKTSNFKKFEHIDSSIITFMYWNGEKGLIILGNTDFQKQHHVSLDLGYYTWKGEHDILWLCRDYLYSQSPWHTLGSLEINLNPGEFSVAELS
ncbi:MAG: maltodextrin glycosyltransferase [Kosmotoga sp.]|nr:MAG: maltodextrin glycosyltransferase [Kosmotoga sp.]